MISDHGWLIHKRPRGESSLSLTLFTKNHGLIRAYYKGGRRSSKKNLPQANVPLWLHWAEKGEQRFIRSVEFQRSPLIFRNLSLISAFYINELLYLCLKHPEPAPHLYACYEDTLHQLAEHSDTKRIEKALRQFEWNLLHQAGASFSLSTDIHNQAILANCHYQFLPQSGFIKSNQGYPGHVLLQMHHNTLDDPQVLLSCKRILRLAINELIQNQPLQSRQLLNDISYNRS